MSTPIAFLHAFPYGPAMWDEQVGLVSHRPLLVPDILGYESFEAAAAEVLLAMDQRGWDKAVLVGLSMGGYTLFRLWNLQPERFAGMVLADTRATPDTPESKAIRAQQATRIQREGMGFYPEVLLPSHLGQTTREQRPELVERVRKFQLEADPHKTAHSLKALANRPDSLPMLAEIDVPTLVLVGEEDTITPLADARQMAQGIPDSRMLIVPGAGHLSNLENPKAFNTALLGFLAELEG
ncbi:MAG: alpha/beta fold hydrolase [Thermaceae bacterium]|nr:alpha/beta fold hydrolase [Thermaceae bacterium]